MSELYDTEISIDTIGRVTDAVVEDTPALTSSRSTRLRFVARAARRCLAQRIAQVIGEARRPEASGATRPVSWVINLRGPVISLGGPASRPSVSSKALCGAARPAHPAVRAFGPRNPASRCSSAATVQPTGPLRDAVIHEVAPNREQPGATNRRAAQSGANPQLRGSPRQRHCDWRSLALAAW